MKILHTSDIHLGELTGPIINGENARMQDTIRCMDFITQKALEEDVDAILIAGDLFNKSKLWADEMLKEIHIATNWLRNLCSIAPTVLMFGTANHDSQAAFENIKRIDIANLSVVTEPELLSIFTKSGMVQIAAVPGVDKGYYRTLFPGMDMEDENKAISEALGNVILGVSAEADPCLPLILMSHYTVTGCTLENGEQMFINSDIVIPTAALAASNYNLVCLGHIHRAQSIPNCSRPVYYSGPPNAITFNEEGQNKGFWIHEIEQYLPYNNTESRFIKTPAREFLTLEWNQEEIQIFIKLNVNDWCAIGNNLKDKIIRVIYSCDDETNKQFNKKFLEKSLYDVGAFFVSEIRPSKIIATVDKNAMSEKDSVESNLRLWLQKQEIHSEDITKIIEIAKPMIAQVSASLPTGKLTGVFEPLRLEVKNYRSYLEEEFDFTKVSFATVNGPNGIGKSSFFMDAIADCLYEEPREGELTGWIANDESIKSGGITFEFLMGKDKWKIVRTRAKPGKSTLSLQRWLESSWQDFSGDRKDHTQEKILNLLGMDALTFKSCALIMQDNYGVFLEADKMERMQVLSNILGLNIYEKLYNLAKEELRTQNRKVEKLKSEIADIDTKLKEKSIHEEHLNSSLDEKQIILTALGQHEEELKSARSKLQEVQRVNSKIELFNARAYSLNQEIEAKTKEKIKLDSDKQRAESIVSKEEKILARIAEYETTRDKITTLKVKLPLLNQKNSELLSINQDFTKCFEDRHAKNQQILKIEEILKQRVGLETAVSELELLEEKNKTMETAELELRRLKQEFMEADKKAVTVLKEYESRISVLEMELTTCKRKAALIDNSKCPLDNPICNFLKDALEARNKIDYLEKQKLECDKSPVYAANKVRRELEEKLKSFNYDIYLHQDIKNQIVQLRKKKEQFLQMNGQEQLLSNLQEQKSEIETNLLALEKKREVLEPEVKQLKEELKELSYLQSILPNLEKWYAGKDELPAVKQLLVTVNERLSVLDKEIDAKLDELLTVQLNVDSLKEKVKETSVSESDITKIEAKIKNYSNELTNIEVAIGIAQSKIDESLTLYNTRFAKFEEIQECSRIANALNLLGKAFSIDGIPFQIVRSVVSELSAQSNEILSQMTGGKMAIEMKTEKILKNKNEVNALEIWISDYQRGTMPYLSRSGGQKVKAALSVAFALADLKANRAGIQLGMMFIDEPPFLDKEGVQAYCDALELMHTRYPSMRVVAISHDPAMKARFPQEIEVMDAGDKGSKVMFN
jgi:exonuclease SbcD